MTELTSGTSTIVALRAQVEKMNNFPVFIEELDEKRIQNIEDLGKDGFSAVPRKKSSKDGKEIVTEINTSFCIGTNHFFENMTFANFSRCIPINLRHRQFDLSNFEYHSKESLKKLSCFLPKILFYRDKILDFYQEQYRIAQIHCDYARICNNVAIGMTIWTVINDILKKEILNTENLVKDYLNYFEPYLDTEISYCDVFLSDVYNLFNKKELLYGREFLITKGKYLRINLNKYCTVYQSVYHKKLHPNEIKIKIANDKRVISLKTTDIKPIGRAIKIGISDNETLLDILNRISKTAEDEEVDDEDFINASQDDIEKAYSNLPERIAYTEQKIKTLTSKCQDLMEKRLYDVFIQLDIENQRKIIELVTNKFELQNKKVKLTFKSTFRKIRKR